ncbi:MAG: two-component system, OmpR family, copper resistance phosphate regulon response regulator CusR [Acidobacteriota bacterium]|jgi:two-component system copper resistance phosphate regulon response regulator CusR|nr:two-component system, OmpR family, copper resistance phosphate regulon response regulator CusR [Acidobacteriota bacterium]
MRVLLVEDDPRIARFVSQGLREQTYAVDVTADGEDALYKAFVNDYDAVILDVMIPGRDGFEVCRELRAAGSNVPVIMLTARDSIQDRIAGLDTGADDYLTKPFEVAELLARLRALLRRGHIVQPAALVIADLVIDTRAHRVTRGNRRVELTAKEYALLEYLAREQGRVLSRAEIAEHVWDENFDPFSNLIDVNINRLRRKIDDGSLTPLIHTRRGEGYMLAAPDNSESDDAGDPPASEDDSRGDHV